LYEAIGQSIYYPTEALKKRIEGKVFVAFVVGTEGKVEDIRVMKGVHPLLDAEALRAVSLLPAFKPGKQNGRPVRVAFTLPIGFRLPANVKQVLEARAKEDTDGPGPNH
jgi:TonB family protein